VRCQVCGLAPGPKKNVENWPPHLERGWRVAGRGSSGSELRGSEPHIKTPYTQKRVRKTYNLTSNSPWRNPGWGWRMANEELLDYLYKVIQRAYAANHASRPPPPPPVISFENAKLYSYQVQPLYTSLFKGRVILRLFVSHVHNA
jgi:hypothetical protein